MKTPHTITLVFDSQSEPTFNPVTGEFEQGASETKEVPCFLNFITQEQQFREYGTRGNRIAIVRFQQPQGAFTHVIYKDAKYKPIEAIDAPKSAIRIQEVE